MTDTRRDLIGWLGLCLLALLSWFSAETPLLLGALAAAKFLGIYWIFMEMDHAHRGWLALALVYLAIWLVALLVG